MKKIVITSGYFNPLHIGHINLIRAAKELGDFLVVIVNNDEQVKLKGGVAFMPELERIEVIRALRYADDVVLSIDKGESVAESLKMVCKKYTGELYFAKGGDRNAANIPEKSICKELGIKIINGVGGKKVQSSSRLIINAIKSVK
jgi:cytidyltransferase-like protein